jgi:rhodanese-related sulfurtransferase
LKKSEISPSKKQHDIKGNCVDFIKENILLIGLAIGSGVMLLLPAFKKNAAGVPNLSSTEAVTLINRSHALVLDVRDAGEFAAGHIAEAKNIDLASLPDRLKELNKYKSKPILVNCQKGVRGAKACEILRKAEFTQVHHLQGGLEAWLSAKLPVVKS